MCDKIRECRFAPYRKGMGPTFTLRVYDTGTSDNRFGPWAKSILAYELVQHDPQHERILLFEGSDFACSPLHAIDSDDCIKSLMGFLTLRLGDTDKDYFDAYTLVQCEFRDTHAESLMMEVYNRFGFED